MFIFGREKMARDLIRLGMKPSKSMDLKFPDLPKEYLRDFIRGVFDGDVVFILQPKTFGLYDYENRGGTK